MNKTIRFSKFFIPAAIISVIIAVVGISGFLMKGFALGVDFQAGLIQEVKLAPTAFSLRWFGTSNAILSFDRSGVYIIISGAETGADRTLYSFPFNEYGTIGSLTQAIRQQLEDIDVAMTAHPDTNSQWLVFSTYGNPYLSSEAPFVVHYLAPGSAIVDITEMRSALFGFGQSVSVQSLGSPHDRHFMIRVEDEEESRVKSDQITALLEDHFGSGEVAVLRSDYVASRFSKDLTDQAGILTGLTLLLILIYASIRFKPQYAFGAVIAIVNDAIVIVSFVVWTRMEFNTSTIAAILTILGYSINNTIVVFDRIRENRKIYPEHSFLDILNISLTAVLSRTVITTFTTMLAVLSLFIFATGSMKDFALALLVGMISGVYTTLFIASGVVYFGDIQREKRAKRKQAALLQAKS